MMSERMLLRLAYLTAVAIAAAIMFGFGIAHADDERQEYLRVTYYVLPGRMADGAMVHDGAAACSQWIPFGTILEFPDGRQVTCHDRGLGDRYWAGWVDVWSPSRDWGQRNVSQAYGNYTWATIIRWGWDE